MKCSACRKIDIDATKPWNRAKLWLFHRFHEEITDLGGERFTQGFADGYKKGREDMESVWKERMSLQQEMMEANQPIPLDCQVNLRNVLDVRKDKNQRNEIYVGGALVSADEMRILKQEAALWRQSRLWSIMQETGKQKAFEQAVLKSTKWEETMAGKMMLHNLGIQRSIIESLESVVVPE